MRLLNGDAYFIYTGMDNTLDSETLLKFRNALVERSLSMRNALIKTRFYKEKIKLGWCQNKCCDYVVSNGNVNGLML